MKRGLFVIASIVLILSLLLSFGISGCTKTEETSTTAAITTTPPPTSTTPATTTTTPTKPVATLSSIIVTPASPADLTVGSTQRFTATGTYTDGSSRQLFSATWTSDNPSVVTIDHNGLATAVAVGEANITASQSGISSSPVSITVVAPPPPPETTTTPGETTTTTPAGPVVYVSVSVDGVLLVAAQPVTITTLTVEAAVIAAHEAYYSGEDSGYIVGTNNAYNMYLFTKCWGVQNIPYFILNDAPLGSSGMQIVNTTPVVANENIIICTGADTSKISPVSLKATISGDSVTLTATAWTLNMATFTYSHAALANANVIDPTTGELLGTTDANGQITITIPASGVVAIEGMAAINVNASAT